jgi:hypothetical protein
MANLPLAFAEILAGAIVLDAGIKGDSIINVVKGKATQQPLSSSSSTAADSTSGSTAAGSSTGGGSGVAGYVNPVPGATTGRVDQGVDYHLGPSGFLAPGNSQIVYTGAGSGWGNEYVAGRLLDGPLKDAVWYIAEAPGKLAGIVQGAVVKAGQQITPAGSSTGGAIEAGWANPANPGNPLAQSLSGYSGDQSLQGLTAGYSFSKFVHALGGPLGSFEGAGGALASTVEHAIGGTFAGVPY